MKKKLDADDTEPLIRPDSDGDEDDDSVVLFADITILRNDDNNRNDPIVPVGIVTPVNQNDSHLRRMSIFLAHLWTYIKRLLRRKSRIPDKNVMESGSHAVIPTPTDLITTPTDNTRETIRPQPFARAKKEMWNIPSDIFAIPPPKLFYSCHDTLLVCHPDDALFAEDYKNDLLSRNIKAFNVLTGDRPLQILLLGDVAITDCFDQVLAACTLCTCIILLITPNFMSSGFHRCITNLVLAVRLQEAMKSSIVAVYTEPELYGRVDVLSGMRGLSYYARDTPADRAAHYNHMGVMFSRQNAEAIDIRCRNEMRLQRERDDWLKQHAGSRSMNRASVACDGVSRSSSWSPRSARTYGLDEVVVPLIPPPPACPKRRNKSSTGVLLHHAHSTTDYC